MNGTIDIITRGNNEIIGLVGILNYSTVWIYLNGEKEVRHTKIKELINISYEDFEQELENIRERIANEI